jgi:hypothetical protein
MRKLHWFGLALIVAPLAFAGACGGDDTNGSGGTGGGTGGTTGTGGGTGGTGGFNEFCQQNPGACPGN